MNEFLNTLVSGTRNTANKVIVIDGKPYTLTSRNFREAITGQPYLKNSIKQQLSKIPINQAINLAVKYRRMENNTQRELYSLGIKPISDLTPTEDLMRMYESNYRRMSNGLKQKLVTFLDRKAQRDARSLRNLALSSNRLRAWSRHLAIPGSNADYRSEIISALRNGIRRTAENRNASTAIRKLRQLRSNASGLGINSNIASAERQIMERMRREQNEKRRIQNANRTSRGLAPLPYSSQNRIPYYPNQPTPRGYGGNMRPTFEAPPNRSMYGAVPRPMPRIPNSPILANIGRQSRPAEPIENYLPPAEKNAILNVGGANKAINLVENAGGAANVAKTANILKGVGGSPEAAVAAGANAKNVKIVLQLGGPNNALKVASAVPKLKKRRRSKKKAAKAAPKPPRVKEIKKLIEYLGSKNNLVKKLPNKENREKKLTKKQIVSKITRHLLRKN